MIQSQLRTIRVLIADDHLLLREGLQKLLKGFSEINIAGTAENGEELIHKTEQLEPDIIFADIQMPVMDGIAATRIIHQRFPATGVIALTMYDDDTQIIGMLEAGAKGYLQKNASKQELHDAIHSVYEGNNYYCRKTNSRLAELIAKSKFNPSRIPEVPQFSTRDLEVIRLICCEYSNKQIAAAMNLSVRTIEGRRDKIQEKMNVTSTAGLVVYAMRRGLYRPV
ncbi:MAG: response regulator transcription factor [Chitinophagaceae bacterium]